MDSRAGCIRHSQIAASGLPRPGVDWDRVTLCRLGCKGELLRPDMNKDVQQLPEPV